MAADLKILMLMKNGKPGLNMDCIRPNLPDLTEEDIFTIINSLLEKGVISKGVEDTWRFEPELGNQLIQKLLKTHLLKMLRNAGIEGVWLSTIIGRMRKVHTGFIRSLLTPILKEMEAEKSIQSAIISRTTDTPRKFYFIVDVMVPESPAYRKSVWWTDNGSEGRTFDQYIFDELSDMCCQILRRSLLEAEQFHDQFMTADEVYQSMMNCTEIDAVRNKKGQLIDDHLLEEDHVEFLLHCLVQSGQVSKTQHSDDFRFVPEFDNEKECADLLEKEVDSDDDGEVNGDSENTSSDNTTSYHSSSGQSSSDDDF